MSYVNKYMIDDLILSDSCHDALVQKSCITNWIKMCFVFTVELNNTDSRTLFYIHWLPNHLSCDESIFATSDIYLPHG